MSVHDLFFGKKKVVHKFELISLSPTLLNKQWHSTVGQ